LEALADAVLQSGALPAAARSDAIHVVAATLAGVDFLLTWNCRNLANPHLENQLRALMAKRGLALPRFAKAGPCRGMSLKPPRTAPPNL